MVWMGYMACPARTVSMGHTLAGLGHVHHVQVGYQAGQALKENVDLKDQLDTKAKAARKVCAAFIKCLYTVVAADVNF